MAMKSLYVCDRCGRPPNGDSPDIVRPLPCGHDLCDECEASSHRHKFLPCPICFDKAHPGIREQKFKCPLCGVKTYGYNWHADDSGNLVKCGFCKREATPIVIPQEKKP